MSEVIDFRQRKKNKSELTVQDVIFEIGNAIDGKYNFFGKPFPNKFYALELDGGLRVPLKEKEDKSVYIVDELMLISAITEYCYDTIQMSETMLAHAKIKEAAKFWLHHTKPVKDIPFISWKNEEKMSYRVLPWNFGVTGETPVFDEMMSRTKNNIALQCFIGSLFFERADRQQYIWVHGEGQNGKGALSRFLRQALNGAYAAQVVPKGDKHWTSGLLGKRLVFFNDCNDKKFVTSGLFKSLTGEDPVRIELKGKPIVTVELDCKYMFSSNERPEINSEKADIRRLILCEMEPIKGRVDPEYQDKLWAEGGFFLNKCINKYLELMPKHGPIVSDVEHDKKVADWVSNVEENFETFFENHFELKPDGETTPAQMQEKLTLHWKQSYMHGQFKSWLERRYGVLKKQRTDGKRTYRGMIPIFCSEGYPGGHHGG